MIDILLHFASVILCWNFVVMLILLYTNASFAVCTTSDTLWKKYIWPFCCYIHCGDCLDLCSPTHSGWGLQWCSTKDTSKLSYGSCWTYWCCSMVCFCLLILVVVHLPHFLGLHVNMMTKISKCQCGCIWSIVSVNIPLYNWDFINRTY